jgi:hypothetical protein
MNALLVEVLASGLVALGAALLFALALLKYRAA